MEADECRICANRNLDTLLDLGKQELTGVYPRSRDEFVPSVPLELIKCSPPGCGLVQLRYTAELDLMYTQDYGYRSGIRPFMINHLTGKVATLRERLEVARGDLVVDIGSNDSTLLRAYPHGPTLVGFDPVGAKFRDLYPPEADLVPEFFTADAFTARYGDRRAKHVTSIAMFYDLPSPMDFMRSVHDVLAPDGLWLTEQSYMPAMLEAQAYDVVCHEHLEYYALAQIEWMAERTGFTVVDAELTDVYGGSLSVVLAKQNGGHVVNEPALQRIRAQETTAKLDTPAPYETFARNVERQRDELVEFLDASRAAGRTTLGYGASTKGNVILQFCGLSEADLPCIGEVSPDKAGRFTPGARIPIVSEEEARSRRPDQLLVLPWIYRDGFVEREQQFLRDGGSLVFPLPRLEVVS